MNWMFNIFIRGVQLPQSPVSSFFMTLVIFSKYCSLEFRNDFWVSDIESKLFSLLEEEVLLLLDLSVG